MAWKEHLKDIDKIIKKLLQNSIIDSINKVSALFNTIDLSEIINVSMLDNSEDDIKEF
ncbi:3924_t:CDS:1, partial [Racocetra fulgida]